MGFGKKNREISIYHASFIDLFASVSAIFIMVTMVLLVQKKASDSSNNSDVANQTREFQPRDFKQTVMHMKTGEQMKLPQVFFYPGNDKLLPGAYETLEDLAEMLNANQKLKIEVQGHIHLNPGSEASAENGPDDLSVKRAKSVCQELIQMGANEDQLVCVGKGGNYPIVQTSDYYKAGINRRVEIVILDK